MLRLFTRSVLVASYYSNQLQSYLSLATVISLHGEGVSASIKIAALLIIVILRTYKHRAFDSLQLHNCMAGYTNSY